MNTYREIADFILDGLKAVSDDSHFTREHMIFFADKVRALLLKQKYSDVRKSIPTSNCQTINVKVAPDLTIVDTCFIMLRSETTIPHTLEVSTPQITPVDFVAGIFNYVPPQRYPYAGNRTYMKNQIYATIMPDRYLRMKSSNTGLRYLQSVMITGVFESGTEFAQCCSSLNKGETCDIMDMTYPLEEGLIPVMVDMCIKYFSGVKYQPSDTMNNANDDLSDLATFMRNEIAKGRYSDLYKTL